MLFQDELIRQNCKDDDIVEPDDEDLPQQTDQQQSAAYDEDFDTYCELSGESSSEDDYIADRGKSRRCGRGARGRGARGRGARGRGTQELGTGGRGRGTRGRGQGIQKKADGNPNWKSLGDDEYVNRNADVEFLEFTGPSREATLQETPLQFLELFFTQEVFKQLANQTNLFYQYLKENSNKPLPPFKETTVPEIMAFLGMHIAMGLGRLPIYDDYWRIGILRMQWFSSIMPRNRFRDILRYFHLVDNRKSVEKGHPDYSKLFKLGGLENKLSNSFSEMYLPGKNLSIDEQMIGMKGRVSFIQYMPKKPKKFGVKMWACCDAESSYCLKFQIYTGASDDGAEHGLSHRVVFDLMVNYLDKAHHLYVDNFYTSLNLVKSLKDRQTYVCGTIRVNRGEFPKNFKDAKLEVGNSIYIEMDGIVAVHWKDKRDVFVMSSIHSNKESTVHRHKGDIVKPVMIQCYNQHMGGVDRYDQRLSYYGLNRKSIKWWKKVFFRLFEMSIVNSMLLFFKKFPEFEKKKYSHKKFRDMLIHEMVQRYLDAKAADLVQKAGRPSLEPKPISKIDVLDATRLTGKHYPSKLNPRRKCSMCAYKINPQTGKRNNKRLSTIVGNVKNM